MIYLFKTSRQLCYTLCRDFYRSWCSIFFTATKSDGLFLWVESAAISFTTLSILQIIAQDRVSIWWMCAIDIIICAIAAPLAAKAYKSQCFETFCGKYFRVSERDSVLHASVDWRDGSIAFVQLKDSTDFYAGYVYLISNTNDPQQWLCLDNPVKYNSDRELIWPDGGQDATKGHKIAFHLEDIQSIEFA